ncbi:MAG: hypothetical protein GX855_02290 [Firmicutes bacterium]|nr:hypothetical protein [Bacillota bacterium]
MLSIVDLLQAGTLDLRLAAHLMRVIAKGASVLACAGPGGTGKTTLLAALLCFLPANGRIQVVERAEPLCWYEEQANPRVPTWFLCHELGPGFWYSYLWGEGAAAFLSMPKENRFCATTVHADSLPELRDILLGREIGISPADSARIDLVLFMRALRGRGIAGWKRRVTEVFAATGNTGSSHQRICHWEPETDGFIWGVEETEAADQPYYDFLRSLKERQIVTIEDVRREVVAFYRLSRSG